MLKPLVKYTFLAFLWQRYRKIIISALLLLFVIFLIVVGHNDYVRYSETTGEQGNIGLSFIIKWLAIIFALLGYLIYVKLALRVKQEKRAEHKPISTDQEKSQDAFAAIRHKKQLRSKAEQLIDK